MDGKKFTMIELKKAGAAVADRFGVDIVTGCKLLGYYNAGSHKDEKIVADIVAGDFSAVPAAAAALNIKFLGGSNKKNSSHGKKNKSVADRKEPKKRSVNTFQEPTEGGAGQQDDRQTDSAAGDNIEKIEGEIIPAGVAVSALPASLPDDVETWLSNFSQRYDIDLVKASGQQWRSACIYIGQHIQKSRILEDKEKEKREGGKRYNAEAVAALLPLWEYVTGLYKHIPLACDFIAFSGVSRNWFYDYEGRGLTSASVQIVKKAREIEESGLSAGLVDGRENPTGRIYYSKARLGWRESVEIVHTSNNNAAAAPALPVFDVSSGLISENVDKLPD